MLRAGQVINERVYIQKYCENTMVCFSARQEETEISGGDVFNLSLEGPVLFQPAGEVGISHICIKLPAVMPSVAVLVGV